MDVRCAFDTTLLDPPDAELPDPRPAAVVDGVVTGEAFGAFGMVASLVEGAVVLVEGDRLEVVPATAIAIVVGACGVIDETGAVGAAPALAGTTTFGTADGALGPSPKVAPSSTLAAVTSRSDEPTVSPKS